MAKQETLTLFPEIESSTRRLTDEQFGILMRSVLAYRFRGETYNGDDMAVDGYVAVSDQLFGVAAGSHAGESKKLLKTHHIGYSTFLNREVEEEDAGAHEQRLVAFLGVTGKCHTVKAGEDEAQLLQQVTQGRILVGGGDPQAV